MAVNDIASVSAGLNDFNATRQLSGDQTLGQQAFLKLLVTQLTNQDPMNPQDQQAFLAQLAQFSTVEAVNGMNSAQQKVQATQLLGKTVAATMVKDNTPHVISGKVTNVRFATEGVLLSVEGSDQELKLSDLTSVH